MKGVVGRSEPSNLLVSTSERKVLLAIITILKLNCA